MHRHERHLSAELSGRLLRAEQRGRYLQAGKLPPKPACCSVKANEIKEDNDKLQEFIEEQCVVGLKLKEPVAAFLIEHRKWRGS
jgi:phage/plasmid-associated DNA primase